MALLASVWDFLTALGSFLLSLFAVVLAIQLFYSHDVFIAWLNLLRTMKKAFHIHRFRDTEGWSPYNWGGLEAYIRYKRCRCGATKSTIKGTLE